MSGAEDRGPIRRLAPLVFPVALWFLATFFLLGDLGKFTDDWYYIQREPETGRIESLLQARPLHFWRPLYRLIVPALETLFWRMDWINHLLSAVAHGTVGWLLLRLMRELRVPGPGAAVAALFFIAWPSHFEPVFWTCALPTILSAGVMVGAWIVQVRFARGAVGAWAYGALPVMVGVAACLNEQATCGLAAMPLLALCARRRERSAARSVFPALASGLVVVAYVWVHRVLDLRPPVIGREGYLPEWSALPGVAARALEWVQVQYTSASYLGRGLEVGAATLREHPWRTGLLCVALAAGIGPWATSLAPRGSRPEIREQGAVAGAGAIAFVATLAPIVAFNYWLMPRVMYAPQMGLSLMIGGIGPLLCGRLAQGGRVLLTAACGMGLCASAVAMVGFQRGFQESSHRTERQVQQLRALVPDPAFGSVFVPVWVSPPVVPDSRAGRYDRFFWTGFNAWWSARWVTRLGYGRSDLSSGHATWYECGILRVREGSVNVRGVGNVDLAKVVPFVIDARGRVRLVTEIQSGAMRARVPQTMGAEPTLAVTVPRNGPAVSSAR